MFPERALKPVPAAIPCRTARANFIQKLCGRLDQQLTSVKLLVCMYGSPAFITLPSLPPLTLFFGLLLKLQLAHNEEEPSLLEGSG
jgi:hypothetical protein